MAGRSILGKIQPIRIKMHQSIIGNFLKVYPGSTEVYVVFRCGSISLSGLFTSYKLHQTFASYARPNIYQTHY